MNKKSISAAPTTEASTDSEPKRQKLSYVEAVAMLPSGNFIHTFRSGGAMLLGADWKRAKILEAIKKHGAELSGPVATAMTHGIVLFDPSPLFIATKEESEADSVPNASDSANASSNPK